MSWPDELIVSGFEICTNIEMNKIKEIAPRIKAGDNPRDYKMMLAKEIVNFFYGGKKANQAEEHFVKTVQKKETPDEVRSKKLEVRSMNILELLIKINLASSKGEARRLILQNGIKVNGNIISDVYQEIKISKDGVLIQRGKRQFVKVKN